MGKKPLPLKAAEGTTSTNTDTTVMESEGDNAASADEAAATEDAPSLEEIADKVLPQFHTQTQ